MTQLIAAGNGQITKAMKRVAEKENQTAEEIRQRVADGRVVIPCNINHTSLDPCGIGYGLKTKVNANIGTSETFPSLAEELKKLEVALAAGADAVMDLSTGGDIPAVRKAIIARSPVPVGTVPIYEAAVRAKAKYGNVLAMTAEDMFTVISEHARDGVDFMTVHCGITREALRHLKRQGRLLGIVSRGGAIMAAWMEEHGAENPLYEQFDRLLEICRQYDVTLSLGDGLRPGALADASDRPQMAELLVLGELVERARQAGVQVMVEGPGHVPLHQVAANVRIQKEVCRGAPFYVLGPLVTDVAPGYDHIVAAIGGAVAAAAGADFLCYVTPAEHLGLPTVEDVREGIIASRIAAHAADIAKGLPGAMKWDEEMSRARGELNWERQIALAIDPERAARYRQQRNPDSCSETCSMCGDYCAVRMVRQHLK